VIARKIENEAGTLILEAENLRKTFQLRRKYFARGSQALHAVDGVTLHLRAGETFGLVGESGCGKSTLGRALLFLDPPSEGRVRFRGRNLRRLSRGELRKLRRNMQMIFQDPYSSLNPRKTAGWLIGEPLLIHGVGSRAEIRERVEFLMKEVGLQPEHMSRFPHEFSGGQRQRIGIARSLALNPDFIVADEPISSLDVSIQAQILELLKTLQVKYHLTYLIISHDLSVIHHVSDRIGVMYLGELVDLAPGGSFLKPPYHPYTEALLAAAPRIDPARRRRIRSPLRGDVPSPLSPPPGCRFHTRCPYAESVCRRERPPLEDKGENHFMACHFR